MHDDLVKLLDLQEKDLTLLAVDARLQSVLGELEAIEAAVRKAEDTAARATQAAQDAARRRDELEAKIDSYRKMQERRRTRLETVRGVKEIAAATAEMDLSRSVLAKEETDWVRSADAVAQLEKDAGVAQKNLAELHSAQQPARDEIGGRRDALEKERRSALKLRDAAAGGVGKPLRSRYERLRSARSSTVVVALNGTACGACFTTVPLNRRSQIRSGTLIDWCEACGVILYATE
ncbi:MAG: hypothetical protein ABJD11_04615 [Gemmatimonadota bacterium]